MENIKEKFENWFTEQHNKWFVKNFNGSCFALMKYNDNVRLKYRDYNSKCIDVCLHELVLTHPISWKTVRKVYEDKRIFNYLWLCDINPYYNDYEKIADNRRYIINSTIDSENKIKPVSNKFAKEMFDKLKAGEKDYVIDSLVNLFNTK